MATRRPYNSFEMAQAQFDHVAGILGLDEPTRDLLRYPLREYQFAIPVRMDDGSARVFRGFRVQHNDARGPSKGGIRFHPQETIDTVRELAMWLSWKCSGVDIPLGGGKGGVDDAEDAEVIVHEYGHAVHDSQVPGFGSSEEAGSIGEAFGDYLAVSVGLAADQQYGWPAKADESCPMDWDATSYTTTVPHCIRRFDRNLTVADKRGEVHFDGQIWSQALWEIRKAYPGLGFTTADWDRTLIDSQFDYAPDTSFSAAAKATYNKAMANEGAAAAALVKDRFAARGITF